MANPRTLAGADAASPAPAPLTAEPPEISQPDARRLVRIVLGGCDSVVTWRRAQILTLAAQKMSPEQIGDVVSAAPGTVRDVILDFSRDGFDSLYARDPGGRSHTVPPFD